MFLFNTFYLRLYGVRHMVTDHSDSKRELPLPPHGLLFPISSKGSFICIIPDRITHTSAFVTPVVEHWLEREIAQWVHHEGSTRRPTELYPVPLKSCHIVLRRVTCFIGYMQTIPALLSTTANDLQHTLNMFYQYIKINK